MKVYDIEEFERFQAANLHQRTINHAPKLQKLQAQVNLAKSRILAAKDQDPIPDLRDLKQALSKSKNALAAAQAIPFLPMPGYKPPIKRCRKPSKQSRTAMQDAIAKRKRSKAPKDPTQPTKRKAAKDARLANDLKTWQAYAAKHSKDPT